MFKWRATGLSKGIWLNKVNGCIPEKFEVQQMQITTPQYVIPVYDLECNHPKEDSVLKKTIDFPIYKNATYGCKVLLGEKYEKIFESGPENYSATFCNYRYILCKHHMICFSDFFKKRPLSVSFKDFKIL